MQKKTLLAFFAFLPLLVFAQEESEGYNAYGIKAGPILGVQTWNGSQTDPLLLGIGSLGIFNEISAGGRNSITIELAAHERGSAILQRPFVYQDPVTNQQISVPATTYERKFTNVGLGASFKALYDINNGWNAYYMAGVRVEYTVRDTIPFSQFQQVNVKTGLNPINYGLSFGGGVERRLGSSPLIMQLDFQIQPDISYQIRSPAFSYTNSYTRNTEIFPEQQVRNVSFELTLGIKWAQYDDE
jgi:hypothetical protein